MECCTGNNRYTYSGAIATENIRKKEYYIKIVFTLNS